MDIFNIGYPSGRDLSSASGIVKEIKGYGINMELLKLIYDSNYNINIIFVKKNFFIYGI